jgi:cell division transport system permease protein
MRSFLYCLQTAAKNLVLEKWINILTVLTIAAGFLILGTFILITLNMDLMIKRWSRGFGLVVYLKDNVNKNEEDLLNEYFKKDKDIVKVSYISKEAAFKELEKTLGSNISLLKGFKENPLPSSFELKLKSEALDPSRIQQKASQIKHLNGVEDVQYGEKWLASLNTMTKGLKIITFIIGSIIFTAVAFATYSTIKILFYRRMEEIETLKLLGATRGFIRLPFLLEGICVGILGGMLSLFGLLFIYTFSNARLIDFLPSLQGVTVFLPSIAYPLAPLVGAVMSLIGSFFAIGKIRY